MNWIQQLTDQRFGNSNAQNQTHGQQTTSIINQPATSSQTMRVQPYSGNSKGGNKPCTTCP